MERPPCRGPPTHPSSVYSSWGCCNQFRVNVLRATMIMLALHLAKVKLQRMLLFLYPHDTFIFFCFKVNCVLLESLYLKRGCCDFHLFQISTSHQVPVLGPSPVNSPPSLNLQLSRQIWTEETPIMLNSPLQAPSSKSPKLRPMPTTR